MNKKYKIVSGVLIFFISVLVVFLVINRKGAECKDIDDFTLVTDIKNVDNSRYILLEDNNSICMGKDDSSEINVYAIEMEPVTEVESDENEFVNNLNNKTVYVKFNSAEKKLVFRLKYEEQQELQLRDSRIEVVYNNPKITIKHPNIQGVSNVLYIDKETGIVSEKPEETYTELKLSDEGQEIIDDIHEDISEALCSNLLNSLNNLYNSDSAYSILSSEPASPNEEPSLYEPNEEVK